MTTGLRECCSFGLPCVSFMNVYEFVCVCASFPSIVVPAGPRTAVGRAPDS